MMKKKLSLLPAVVFCAFSMQALALPVTTSQVDQISTQFNFNAVFGTGSATVISTVYAATGGGYLYTYEIKDATVNLSWFSVGLISGAVVDPFPSYDPGVNNPASWLVVGNPAISVDALFSTPVGPTKNSSVIWFTSPNDRTTDVGALGGYGSKGYNFLQGSILTPIPEPATFALLGVGLLALRKKRTQ